MTFTASKKRVKKVEPFAEGLQLIPSAATSEWYRRELVALIASMVNEYSGGINSAFQDGAVRKYYAADASPITYFIARMNVMRERWEKLFHIKAKELSEKIVSKADEHSKTTVKASLKTLGIIEPKTTYTQNIANTLKANQEFNNTLITGIQKEFHEKIFKVVMASLSSPDPSQQGQKAIISALNDIGISDKKRAKLIARDQTSKVYAALNIERMQQNGITHFKWIHSSAGKVPRESHVAKNNQIFEINDPRLWEGPKSDQGPPGHAINCRCRAVPVIDIED